MTLGADRVSDGFIRLQKGTMRLLSEFLFRNLAQEAHSKENTVNLLHGASYCLFSAQQIGPTKPNRALSSSDQGFGSFEGPEAYGWGAPGVVRSCFFDSGLGLGS